MGCTSPYSIFDAAGSHTFRKRAVDRKWFCFSFESALQGAATITSVVAVNITHPTEDTPSLKVVNDSQEGPIPNPAPWTTETGSAIPTGHGARVMFEDGTPGELYDAEVVVRLSDGQTVSGMLAMQIDPTTGAC